MSNKRFKFNSIQQSNICLHYFADFNFEKIVQMCLSKNVCKISGIAERCFCNKIILTK